MTKLLAYVSQQPLSVESRHCFLTEHTKILRRIDNMLVILQLDYRHWNTDFSHYELFGFSGDHFWIE